MKKTCILSALMLVMVHCTFAQNEMAVASVSSMDSKKMTFTKASKPMNNSHFVSSLNQFEMPILVQKMRSKVAAFNIDDLKVYTSEESVTYTVAFDEGDCEIEAIFNARGEILKSVERYKNLKVPYAVGKGIAKDNPGWRFEKSFCKITYDSVNTSEIVYHVTLEKEGKHKKVKVRL